jgi:hypothetical protein
MTEHTNTVPNNAQEFGLYPTGHTSRKMPSSGMLRRVALVRTNVSEECSAVIRATRIGEIGTTVFLRSVRRLLVSANVPSSSILVTLMMVAIRSSEMSVHTRVTTV